LSNYVYENNYVSAAFLLTHRLLDIDFASDSL